MPLGLSQLDKAKAAADHLLSVINDILDISKIEAGYLELEQIDFRLDDVLRNLLNLVGNRAAEKGLKLMIDQDVQGVGPLLRGDPLRLGQILLNLVGNAIKFSDQGDIVVRIAGMRRPTDGVRLRFEIEDQGIGIDPEKQERLFVAFEQADGSMTRKYGGTGLGLAISKRLVRKMGGEIGVDSKPGQGSRFWFVACFGAAAPAEPNPPYPMGNRGAADWERVRRRQRPPCRRRTHGSRSHPRAVIGRRSCRHARGRWRRGPAPGSRTSLRLDPDGHADAEPEWRRCRPVNPKLVSERHDTYRCDDCECFRRGSPAYASPPA
jgi:hypothetical protein